MAFEENEKALMKYIYEFRLKPSKVSAELFYFSRTNASWKAMEKLLFNWLDIYSELGCSDVTTFVELRALVENIRPPDEQYSAETSSIFYSLRTHDKELMDENKETLMHKLSVNNSPKSLICQTFISLRDENLIDVFKYFKQAIEDDAIDMTRSVLTSLSKKDLLLLKTKFSDGHTRSLFDCTCNPGKISQHVRKMTMRLHVSWMVGGKLPQCKVLNIITELENLLKMLSSCAKDLSAIHELHLAAERHDLARHFSTKFKNSIHKKEIET